MIRISTIGIFTVLVFGLLIICGCETIDEVIHTDPSDDPIRVTMVYPSDCVDDSSYCIAFHIGVRTAESELDIVLTEVNGMENDPVATEMIFRDVAQNSELVLTAGYQMGHVLTQIAPEYSDVKFAIFDSVVDFPNVTSVNYKDNEGSFLVGAIAALKTETDMIGYIGGADVAKLHEFEAGYIAGIQHINPIAEISVDYISTDATGFNQPERAKELALAQYANGVDVIFAAAGGAGQGVLEAAQEQNKFIIWVDSNGNHLAPGLVLTSMTKEISTAVQRIIQETVEDNYTPGVRYFGLADGVVNYTVDEHNQSVLSNEMIEKVESLKKQIIAGEIVVPDKITLPRE